LLGIQFSITRWPCSRVSCRRRGNCNQCVRTTVSYLLTIS